MSKHIISREYWFAAAHRLEGHPKCGRLHGHNYRVVVSVKGTPDEQGFVIDYGELDTVVKPLIDGLLDHRYIYSAANRLANDPYGLIAADLGHAYILPLHYSASTAENLSEHIFELLSEKVSGLVSVQVDETPKSSAVCML